MRWGWWRWGWERVRVGRRGPFSGLCQAVFGPSLACDLWSLSLLAVEEKPLFPSASHLLQINKAMSMSENLVPMQNRGPGQQRCPLFYRVISTYYTNRSHFDVTLYIYSLNHSSVQMNAFQGNIVCFESWQFDLGMEWLCHAVVQKSQ